MIFLVCMYEKYSYVLLLKTSWFCYVNMYVFWYVWMYVWIFLFIILSIQFNLCFGGGVMFLFFFIYVFVILFTLCNTSNVLLISSVILFVLLLLLCLYCGLLFCLFIIVKTFRSSKEMFITIAFSCCYLNRIYFFVFLWFSNPLVCFFYLQFP